MLLIPAGQPQLKQVSDMANGADRLAMCRRAVHAGVTLRSDERPTASPQNLHRIAQHLGGGQTSADDTSFDVSDIEVLVDRPSFTLTTARRLRETGLLQINWLIGADQLNSLPRWHEPEALIDEINFIVMARPGYELNWSALPKYMQHLQQNLVQAPHLDISATNIRQRVAKGLPIDWLTPPGVVQYIRERGLYRGGMS